LGAETAENLFLGFGCRGKGFFAKVSIQVHQPRRQNLSARPGCRFGFTAARQPQHSHPLFQQKPDNRRTSPIRRHTTRNAASPPAPFL